MDKTYIAIDLKSFYASVECRFRHLDPLTTNLVVADTSRTEKTICLAVSPSLKAYGIPGRPRLFEVVQAVKSVNANRRAAIRGQNFRGLSTSAVELSKDPYLELDYIAATPQMKLYEDISAKIYSIYLRYVAPEDIHVYSIDEVFLDVTAYLNTYQMTARELTEKMIHDVLSETGITATAGIAPNMYLCKVAMDIVAKHIPADENGVRIAELDEMGYRRLLWNHRPLTDFWRVGGGIARRLEKAGIYTMGDIARIALQDENYFFKMFGINAEYLIDHAFGRETTTIADIKGYKPKSSSTGTGQVLSCAYDHEKTRIILREMTELLALDLVDKKLEADQVVLTIGFDRENLDDPEVMRQYTGPISMDYYGRIVPSSVHGSSNLGRYTSSSRLMTEHVLTLFEALADPILSVRRINITANHTRPVSGEHSETEQNLDQANFEQMDLFGDNFLSEDNSENTREAMEEKRKQEELLEAELEREHRMQVAMLSLKKRFGKNSILKGTDLQEGANTIERNNQIGGHKA